ncbi:MAG TPA: hypothetical protein VER08_03420 [Pyrinomonadaceae bacterium]|nr:hypothetical protein [Pyrinomonadaceae bacterium]
MYQPFPREKFESTERDLWFQELAEHVRQQAESRPYVTDMERIATLPREARALYFLWMFYAEVGGNGIEHFLLEPQGLFTPQAHEALRMVGASELVERLEAGIPHALASDAEFSAGSDVAWFRQFRANPKYPTLQSVDDDIHDLAGDDLREKANAFIESQRGVLVA